MSSDGETVAIGAPKEDSTSTGSNDDALDSGAVYVFVRDGAAWSHEAFLKASNAGAGDQFGFAVALSADGNTLVVGAPEEDSGSAADEADNSTTNNGAAYVFRRTGATWSQEAYLKPAVIDVGNIAAEDHFGYSVSISGGGGLVAIGSPQEDGAGGSSPDPTNNAATDSGAVYAFERNGVAWSQRGYHKATPSRIGNQFGFNVALSSDGLTLAAGAPFEDSDTDEVNGDATDTSASGAGAAYLFFGFNDLSQTDYIKAKNSGAGDGFGVSVSLSGNGTTLVVASHREDSKSFGIDGDDADDSAESSGAAYVFTKSANVWQQETYLKPHNTGAGDFFGRYLAVSSDGTVVAVGALFEDTDATGIDPTENESSPDSGAAYLFKRDQASWKQEHFIKSANADSVDCFGVVVALDASGATFVTGAYLEDSAAKMTEGDPADDSAPDSGAAYVFDTSQ